MKFLHLSDIHIGCDLYKIKDKESLEKDYFRAFHDVIQKYAIAEKVDFVLIVGDLLHKAQIYPEHMNQAYAIFNLLKKEKIPAVIVEGNHDKKFHSHKISWLQTLSRMGDGYIFFLAPEVQMTNQNQIKWIFSSWNEKTFSGGYVDIGQARIFGLNWLGNQLDPLFPSVLEGLRQVHRKDGFNILMIHGEIQGHEKGSFSGLSRENLEELKEVIDYLALGHVHKKFEVDNWIFNPGALLPTSIDEYKEERGAWLIEVDNSNQILSKKHVKDYYQRPFERIEIKTNNFSSPKELYEEIENLFQEKNYETAIVEITLSGFLRFSRSSLDTKKISDLVQKLTGAYHVKVRNYCISEEIKISDTTENNSNKEIEKQVIRKLIMQDSRYNKEEETIERMIQIILGSKDMAVNDEPAEKIFNFIESKVLMK